MANRTRNTRLRFRVSDAELAVIRERMQQYGTGNMEAFLRKMALDGYIVKLDLPELKELLSLLRRSGNNLNQLTRRVHETSHIYDADLDEIHQDQEQLLAGVQKLLQSLSAIL